MERRQRRREPRAVRPEDIPSPRRDERTLGELFRALATETRTLVRQEIRLATREASDIATEAGQNVGMIAAGGFVAYAGFLTLLVGMSLLLGLVMPLWLSFSLVGLGVLVIGYALYRSGRKGLDETDFSFDRTTETLQEDKQWMKEEAQDVKDHPSRLGARR